MSVLIKQRKLHDTNVYIKVNNNTKLNVSIHNKANIMCREQRIINIKVRPLWPSQ